MDDVGRHLGRLVDLCEKSLAVLPTDQALLDRLLYKFRNAHRRTIYYRKLVHVRKRLQLANLSGDVAFLKQAAGDPSARNEKSFVDRLHSAGCRLDEASSVILGCSWHLFQLLKQTFFMSMALAFVSILARAFVVFRAILQALSETLTLLNVARVWQESADDRLRKAAHLLSNRYTMAALPNSPERSDSESEPCAVYDRSAPAIDLNASALPEEIFSDDLLDAITVLEQECDSDDDIATKQTEPVHVDRSAAHSVVNERIESASSNDIETESALVAKRPVRPERKPSKRSKKRRRDDMDDIFDVLE